MKVLIADSDWHFSQRVSRFLESRAHLVVHEGTLGAALEQARRWLPDLVILASELALHDGVMETLSSLVPRPAVLLTEGLDRFDRAWRAWQQGGDELLLKPVLSGYDLHQAIVTARENAAAGVRAHAPAAVSA
ncbi:MAG: response regulator [Phycisphaerae bacterium]|nr:response regulator [Phycisphaerae bacterium]